MSYKDQRNTVIKLIYKFGKTWMLYDEEVIGEIIGTYIKAKCNYVPGVCKESTYIIASIKNKIYDISKNRKYTIPISKEIHSRMYYVSGYELSEFIDSTKILNLTEKLYIKQHYFGKNSITDIAELNNVSKQYVSKAIKSGLEKLRRIKYVFQK